MHGLSNLVRHAGGLRCASKSRAVRGRPSARAVNQANGPGRSIRETARTTLTQGYSAALRWLAALSACVPMWAAAACDRLAIRPLAPGLWLVQAGAAETDAGNRGQVVNLVLARDGPRLWALGSGATPVLGSRLRCTARQSIGRFPTDLVTPLAQAEFALGAAGLAPARHWAHAQVADAMASQCPHCVERLRQRLGASASDLGDDPVRLPARRLSGPAGRLGPFDWWALPRDGDRVATVWRHRASGWMVAPGLLWGDGVPDLRDTDVATMQASLARLLALQPGLARWVGQTGPPLDATGAADQLAYVRALWRSAVDAAERGQDLGEVPPMPGTPSQRHALNWQRAWIQAEDQRLRDGRPDPAAEPRRR